MYQKFTMSEIVPITHISLENYSNFKAQFQITHPFYQTQDSIF